MLKDMFFSISSAFPFSFLRGLVSIPVISPFYHLVTDNSPPHMKYLYNAVSVKQFTNDIDFMLKHYTPVAVEELPKILLGEKCFSKPALFLSFDDGFSELKSIVAPILRSKGVPATFFVTPNFIDNSDMLYRCKLSIIADSVCDMPGRIPTPDFLISKWGGRQVNQSTFRKQLFRLGYNDTETINAIAKSFNIDFNVYLQKHKPYLNLNEVKGLAADGFAIGAHSMDHPNFAEIPPEMQKLEILNSLEWVQKNVPNQQKLFAFPFSSDGVSANVLRYFLKDNSKSIDMMFGTSGLKLSPSSKLLQRIPMEIKGKTGEQILKGEYLYYIAKAIVGKNKTTLPI
ncbi:MAG: polysaccharide deacetylase family protein [Bacteroidales bacterium]